MGYSLAKRKSTLRTLSVFAAISISLAAVGSVILASAGLQWESLGTLLFRMGGTGFLLTMITLFFVLLFFRYIPPVEIQLHDDQKYLWISPVSPNEAITITSLTDEPVNILREFLKPERSSHVRVVIAQDKNLGADFFHSLLKFPNLLVLDIQRSKLDAEALDALTELWNLETLLVHGVIGQRDALGLELLLPEVKIVYESRKIGLVNQAIQSAPPPIRFGPNPTQENFPEEIVEAQTSNSPVPNSPVSAEIQ